MRRRAAARDRRQFVEVRKEVRQRGAADALDALLAEARVAVLGRDVGGALLHRGPDVARRHVDQAREVEEPRAAHLVAADPAGHVARGDNLNGLRIRQQRREQKYDEAHAEERGDGPDRAAQRERKHAWEGYRSFHAGRHSRQAACYVPP